MLQFVYADDEEDKEDIVKAVFDPSNKILNTVQNREDIATTNKQYYTKNRKKKIPIYAEF